MTEHTDKTTVAQIGDVTIIGEEHRNTICGELAQKVLDDVNPRTIAVENTRGRRYGNAAMGVVSRYAENNNLPCVGIDGEHTWDDPGNLIERANHFEYPIEDDGDLDQRAIDYARELIVDEFGLETARKMHADRELVMARHLNRLSRSWDGPILVAMGAFHVQEVARMMDHVGAVDEIDDRRIRWNGNAAARGATV